MTCTLTTRNGSASNAYTVYAVLLARSIAREREDRRKASEERQRLESTGMDPERAAREAAAITSQASRRRAKPPSLVLLDAATEEAMKKEANLKRQHEVAGTGSRGRGRGDSASGGKEQTVVPSTTASGNPRKRLKNEPSDAATTRTAAIGAGLSALLHRERERARADNDKGSGGTEKSKVAGAQKKAPQQPDHTSIRTAMPARQSILKPCQRLFLLETCPPDFHSTC